MNTTSDTFGCGTCWPASADIAWEALKSLRIDIGLVEESHFMIKLRSCKVCAQHFLFVFTETVDWEDGDDPQFWTVIPLTSTEAGRMSTAGSAIEASVIALPRTRQSLCHDNPKDGKSVSYWSHGIVIRHHN